MGVYKNLDSEDQTNLETSTRQYRDNFDDERMARGVQGNAGDNGPGWPPFPVDDELIPWKFVPQQIVRQLVQKLNPELLISGNNWRALADQLGLNSEDIRFVESVKGVHAEVLLNEYSVRSDASLNEMLKALKSINRRDCVEILCEGLPEIRQRVEAGASTPSRLQMGESMSSILSGQNGVVWPNGATMLVPAVFPNGASSLVAVSQPGPAGVCYMSGPTSLPCGYAAGFRDNNSFSLQGSAATQGMGGFFGGSQRHCMQERQQGVPPRESFGELGCMLVDNHSPLHSSFPGLRGNLNNCNTAGNIPNGGSSNKHTNQTILRQYSDDPRARQHLDGHDRKQLQHSLSAQSFGHGSCQHCGVNARPYQGGSSSTSLPLEPQSDLAYFSSQSPSSSAEQSERFTTPSGSDCSGVREKKSSPRKLLLSSPSSSTQDERETSPLTSLSSHSFPNRCCSRMETPTISSGRSSSASSSSGQTILGTNPARPQAFTLSEPAHRDGPKFNPQNRDMCSNLPSAGYASAGKDQGSDSRTSPRGQGRQHQGPKLSPLEKIEAMRDKYKPSSNYQTVVAEQKIDVERSKKIKPGKPTKQNHAATSGGSTLNSLTSNTSDSFSSTASHTYPMRVKARQEWDVGGVSSVEDLGSLTISKKSVSMPQNMKPQPYRKAWRGIKVFVTYSMDNPSHNNEVLCLGYFLKNNGFNCFLDTPISQSKSSEAWLEHLKKFRRKFDESDFILVCISPKYLQDVSGCSRREESAANDQRAADPRLHTLDIYQWMNQEYLNKQAFGDGADQDMCGMKSRQPAETVAPSSSSGLAQSPQVVPVLFGSMSPAQIPPWMLDVGVPCKRWEADYADLAWLLTKPQTRIRPATKQTTHS